MKPKKTHQGMALAVILSALSSLLLFPLSLRHFFIKRLTAWRRMFAAVRSLIHFIPDLITGRIMRYPKAPEFRHRWVHVPVRRICEEDERKARPGNRL